MTTTSEYTEPLREMGYDQTAVPSDAANTTPAVEPTVESVEKACADDDAE